MMSLLEQSLQYTFKDSSLLTLALTHRSKGGHHNERLEFLGDAIVNFVIADILFQKFPKASEGELSRYRASLVNRDTLAQLGKYFQLGDHLILGIGELKSGGRERDSILSCAMEAIIGAIYLDAGFDTCYQIITAWYDDLVSDLSAATDAYKDSKTLLQEWLQGRRYPLPKYVVRSVEGAAHEQSFTITCSIQGLQYQSEGQGTSRRRAEQAAAEAMLTYLENHPISNDWE